MSKAESAHEVIERIEKHCGEKIKPRRLRFHIVCEIERQIAKHDSLHSRISNVLQGEETYDPKHRKPIALSDREKGAE